MIHYRIERLYTGESQSFWSIESTFLAIVAAADMLVALKERYPDVQFRIIKVTEEVVDV